ncbi:MAG: Uma2 family endonuclease [Phycisphaerales bacterium]|nr:Uma2 family endonuclease [Phycisphaerales bacterium]
MAVDTIDPRERLREGFLAVRYGATPTDWEETAGESHFVELIDGRLIVHSPAGLRHQRIFGFLHQLVAGHVERNGLGEVLSGPFTMDLGVQRKFEPDLIFVALRSSELVTHDRLLGAADLVIEIASPSTAAYDRGEKRECYRVGRVGEYWMIDPAARRIAVDAPAGQELGSYAEGWVESNKCPGFAVRAEWFWVDPLPRVVDCIAAMTGR